MEDSRPRLLVLGGRFVSRESAMDVLGEFFDVHFCESMDEAMAALRSETFHVVFADAGDYLPLERAIVSDKSAVVLDTIGEGVCVMQADGRCSWSNSKMRTFHPEVMERVKQITLQARSIFENDRTTREASAIRGRKFTFQHEERYFELMCSPVWDKDQISPQQVVTIVWDATSGRRLQQKIDAIDASGRELARIDAEAISHLQPSERLKLLRDKIIRYSKDLMHFDHFAVRLLDRSTNKLEVVIAEGLPEEALDLDLYAQPEGNGIGGYVAATGRSYICHDTEKDPRYVQGLTHCKSSMTVPLTLYDKVIGVYNVESERVGAFNEDDRQFAEIFARYVAMALNVLDLLVVERCAVTGTLADNVVQEIAQPLNDIVTEAQTLIEEYIGEDQMRQRLHRIVDQVETIRQTVRNVTKSPNTVLGHAEFEKTEVERTLDGIHVLIADDDEKIRETIGSILKRHGCNVTLCKDGYEAVAMLEQRRFSLVISDIKMPYRNGYEIFAAAKRLDDHLPVILMTGFGYDPHHSIVRASQEGLSSVLFKPFKVDQLMDDVYQALKVERKINQPVADGNDRG